MLKILFCIGLAFALFWFICWFVDRYDEDKKDYDCRYTNKKR
jgi:hypothetical protein